jgi:DNA repair exonuclease SbcCD ATPase subunit
MENLSGFFQILLWIVLPALLLSVVVTVILHYWRKRISEKKELEELLSGNTPDINDNQPVEPILSEKLKNKDTTMSYTDEIEKNREVITHLKSEFSFLEKKYEDLKAIQHNNQNGIKPYETQNAALNEMLVNAESKITALNNDLQHFKNRDSEHAQSINVLNNEIAELKNAGQSSQVDKDAKNTELENRLQESEMQLAILHEEMAEKLKVIQQEFLQLQAEKDKLYVETAELKQLAAQSINIPQAGSQPVHTDEEYENLLKENEKLVNKVSDYSYFEDLINEKKQQIAFLENQIEQRVKQVHDTEQNFYGELKKVEMYGAQIAALKAEYDDTSNKLAEQIKVHNSQVLELDKFKNKTEQQDNVINEKQYFINELENKVATEKESSELLKQTISADKITITQLTLQTEEQFRKIEELEGKLKISSQLLARIYTDLGKSFASIFSDDANILPDNIKIKELSKKFSEEQEEAEVTFHS